jgi:hypothetical protein
MEMLFVKRFASALALILAITASAPSLAISTFARQTGMACAACHFQNYPALNQLGRSFKANGYALSVLADRAASQSISISDALNAGVITKLRYQQSNGPKVAGTNSTNDGELQFPDELLLNMVARISNNIGAMVELDLNNASPLVSGLKLPFIYNVNGAAVGAIPFSTSSQGAAYGFELLNTGAVRFSRVAEDRSAVSAQQYIGTATKAQGIAAVASNAGYFGNFSKWSPRSFGDNSGTPTANYLRLAMTPQVGVWDLGLGVQSWSGHATEPSQLTQVNTKAWAIDAQAQATIGKMPLGIYLSHANAEGTPAGSFTPNLFNSKPNDRTATAIVGQLGVQPGKSTVLLSYRHGDNGSAIDSTDNAWMIGGTYSLVQNVQLQLNYTEYSGSAYNGVPKNGDHMMTLMLYTAF